MKKLLALSLCSLIISGCLLAEDGRPPRGGKPPFVTACEGKSEGDSCSFTDRSGSTVADQCQNSTSPRGDTELTCGAPKAPPQGQGGRKVQAE